MKQLITAAVLAAAAFAVSAQTAAPAAAPAATAKAPTAQQSKMGDCAKDNAGKKGQDYKDGMKACLSAKKDARTTQQEKMKTCNADAKTKALKGADRKAFMKDCLSK